VLDDLTAQTGEKFLELEKAPDDANFKGVAFAPTAAPEPSTWAMMLMGFLGFGYFGYKTRLANVLQALKG
jgi:hypothetical protein